MIVHSELGASVCKRFWNCPGSVALSRGLPNLSSSAAEEGTAAHALGELCLTNRQDAAEYVGRHVHDRTVNAAMADAVQVYLDECRRVDVLPSNHQVEARFSLETLDPPAPMFGTADFVAYISGWKQLRVVDLKYGRGVQVEAEGNPQLRYYALGALLTLGPGKPVKEIEAVIVQPRAPGGAAIRRTMIDPMELIEWSIELMDRARATLAPDAPLHAGEWCRFCPAAGRCPEQSRSALAVAQNEFGAVPEIRLLTPDAIGRILHFLPQLEQFVTDIRKAAHGELRAGRGIPGWKLVAGDRTARWASPATLAADVEDMGAQRRLAFAPLKLRTPANMRDALADALRPGYPTKKAAVEAARELLAPLIVFSASASNLAPEADPRPAITAAGAEFLTLPETQMETE